MNVACSSATDGPEYLPGSTNGRPFNLVPELQYESQIGANEQAIAH